MEIGIGKCPMCTRHRMSKYLWLKNQSKDSGQYLEGLHRFMSEQ